MTMTQEVQHFLVRDMSESPTYMKPTILQTMEWDLEAAKTEIAGLQVTVSVLTAEKDTLEQKLSEKDEENEKLKAQFLETGEKLQEAATLNQTSEQDLEEKIALLESEVEHGAKELVERIEYLEQQLNENSKQLTIGEAALAVKEEVLATRETELEEREKETERVRDFFAAGNDVNGLVLDLQGRIKKQEEEIQLKENHIMTMRVKLERSEQEMLAIKQTLRNQPKKMESFRAPPIPRPRSASRPQISKQNSLPSYQHQSIQVQPQHRWSLQPQIEEEDRIYDKPSPPVPVYRRLPFSLDWDTPLYTIDHRKKIVNGVSIYSQKENKLYFSSILQQEILAYTESQQWETLPSCPHKYFGLVMVEDNVTTIGGKVQERASPTGDGNRSSYTDKLLSYVTAASGARAGQWVELFPPMPSKRASPAAVSTSRSLIVAGGDNGHHLRTVEVMDLTDKQWHTASILPRALSNPSMVLCETTNRIYLSGQDNQNSRTQVLFNCSIHELLRTMEPVTGREYEDEPFYGPSKPKIIRVWNELPSTPNDSSTLAIVDSHVMVAGGIGKKGEASNEIYYLDMSHCKWEHIAQMPTARHGALVGFNSSTEKLVIIGGFNKTSIISMVNVAKFSSS